MCSKVALSLALLACADQSLYTTVHTLYKASDFRVRVKTAVLHFVNGNVCVASNRLRTTRSDVIHSEPHIAAV